MNESARVLLVEDNPGDARLISIALSESGGTIRFDLTVTDELSKAFESLTAGDPAAILLDLNLPDSQGLSTVINMVEKAPDVPIIVLTGLDDEALAIQAVQNGAQDYLVKNQLDSNVLSRTIRYAIERKQAEQALRESQARLAGIIRSAMDAIVTIDEEQRIALFNPAAEHLFRCSTADVIGQPLDCLLPERFRSSHREHVRLYGETEYTEQAMGTLGELYGLRADGEEFPIEASISQLEAGGQKFYTVILRDVTERRRAEAELAARNDEMKLMSQQLWQAAKLATMGELAASIAHELNNPLATVSLRVEMLSGQVAPDSAQSRSLQIIDSEVKRMSSLIANLLQYSRRTPRQISTCNLCEEIVSTLELIRYHLSKYSILTVQEFSPETPLVQVDLQQLRQVFLNLFTNAADAMLHGGTLTVRTRRGEKPTLGTTAPLRHATTGSSGLLISNLPQIFIEVSDTGEGIPPENLDRVWEPFYTTKPEGKGTGLGLAICRRIIQEHGGTIEILSEGIPGKGTTIRITLPALKGD